MNATQKRTSLLSQVRNSNLAFIILCTVLFTLSYSQAPLFTSNQNQYFLHGLAEAGVGYLSEDWLVSTLDPTPVFSSIVYTTYQLFGWLPVFYIYFGILAGVYLYSLIGVADQIWGIKKDRQMYYSFLMLFMGLHAAALRFLLVRAFGANWAYLFDGGFAGQRLLGEVLQPSTFGVLLLLSINLFLRGKHFWSIMPLVLAPTIHPTYLLSAAVLTVIYMGSVLWEKRDLKTAILMGVLALLGVLPILIHTATVFQSTAPYNIIRARDLLVNFRIPHHALPTVWWDATSVVKLGLILLALFLARKTRIFPLLLVSLLIATVLTGIQLATQNHMLALLFPWRMSTFLVPLSLSLLVGYVVVGLDERYRDFADRYKAQIIAANLIIVVLLALAGVGIFVVNRNQKIDSPARSTFNFVAENKAPGQNYLIPLDMQDFRLETGVPAFVEFKSIPYRDEEVLEWYRRVSLAGRLYQAPNLQIACQVLDEIIAEGVTHVILPYDHTAYPCPPLERLFLEFETYDVFVIAP